MPKGLSYEGSIIVVMPVRDFKKACDWYANVLGLSLNYADESIPWADFSTSAPGCSIGISPNPEGAGKSGETVTFGVADIEGHRAELEARGVTFTGPTEGIPGVVLLAPFVDLDGNPLLLAQTMMPTA